MNTLQPRQNANVLVGGYRFACPLPTKPLPVLIASIATFWRFLNV
jgi:hypothetical protein